jgi:sortase A
VGLSVIVLEGSDTLSLRLGVGHIRGTALPGEPGNVVLAGHRDTFFRPLAGVRANDEIILTAGQQKSRYRVESLQVVDREQTEALRSTPEPAVTLIICYPFSYVGSAPQRLIVRALERKE